MPSPRKLEISKVLVCSTAHVTREEINFFAGNCYMEGEHSFIASVYSLKECDIPRIENPSEGLKGILALAEKNGAHYIIFDSDGPVIKGVPTYETAK